MHVNRWFWWVRSYLNCFTVKAQNWHYLDFCYYLRRISTLNHRRLYQVNTVNIIIMKKYSVTQMQQYGSCRCFNNLWLTVEVYDIVIVHSGLFWWFKLYCSNLIIELYRKGSRGELWISRWSVTVTPACTRCFFFPHYCASPLSQLQYMTALVWGFGGGRSEQSRSDIKQRADPSSIVLEGSLDVLLNMEGLMAGQSNGRMRPMPEEREARTDYMYTHTRKTQTQRHTITQER